ncbi:hypothetical protein XENOCAPTIV_022753, partial [Xenoophorus captivus]
VNPGPLKADRQGQAGRRKEPFLRPHLQDLPRCWRSLKQLQDVRLCLQFPPHWRYRVSVCGGIRERLHQHAGVSSLSVGHSPSTPDG